LDSRRLTFLIQGVVTEIASWAIGRWYKVTIGHRFFAQLKLPSLAEAMPIFLQLSFRPQSPKYIAAVSALLQILELFPEKKTPYFADILENAQLAIKHTKVNTRAIERDLRASVCVGESRACD